MRKRKNSGLSNAVTDLVSLKVLSWNVAGLAEDFTDIFLSQISMLADWDVLLLQECFRELDGVNVGAHELFTPSELMGGLRCPADIVNQKWKGQSKIVGCGKMDCGRAGWTADPHFSTFATQRKEIGRIRGSFDGNPGIREWETQTTRDLSGGLQCKPLRYDRFFHVGESIPRPRALVDTNDSLRARALHTMVTELDLTVTNTWMNADTERELFTRSSWSNPEDSLTQMDFVMTSRKRSQSGACSSFDETEHEVHDEEGCKPAWLGARRLLAQSGCRNADRLEELENDGTFAYGKGSGSQKIGNQGDVTDRIGAQITSVEKEENWTVPRANRIELALSRNLEKEKSVQTRETLGQDQVE